MIFISTNSLEIVFCLNRCLLYNGIRAKGYFKHTPTSFLIDTTVHYELLGKMSPVQQLEETRIHFENKSDRMSHHETIKINDNKKNRNEPFSLASIISLA